MFLNFIGGDPAPMPVDSNEGEKYAWLEEQEKPENFSVVGALYRGPKAVKGKDDATVKKKKKKKNDSKKSVLRGCKRRIKNDAVAVEEEKEVITPCPNDDVVANILARIPADVLYNKFRYLSQEWSDMLLNSSFTYANSLHSKVGIIFMYDQWHVNATMVMGFMELEGLELKIRELNVFTEQLAIMSSCNGLVLVRNDFTDPMALQIMNPMTKESIRVPQCEHHCLSHDLVFLRSTREYKLVDMFYDNSDAMVFHVRSIGGSWNDSYCVSDSLRGTSIRCSYTSLGWDMFWFERISIDGILYVNFGSYTEIVSFDVCNGKAQVLKLPSEGAVQLIELSGFIAIINTDGSDYNIKFPINVWILKSINSGEWERKFRISGLKPNKKKIFALTVAICLFTRPESMETSEHIL
ncbi:hypothetical protein IFM89_034955 [Coptis chinensis]|uniref:F-box associated beta-propeller type 3 domain-containing protein n=1 Tax=Coptis chinensis TaxID=261450 RepID=A0A835MEA4_9MAGN|nr:hypothetical protein IFM89_034955 [Coptis chinensis]